MYTYDKDTNRHRTYRPDLQSTIETWLASVPDQAWQYFVGFRVGDHGEFIAKFMKEPSRGGDMRVITFSVDHNHCEMTNDAGYRWFDPRPVRFTMANLNMAVDRI